MIANTRGEIADVQFGNLAHSIFRGAGSWGAITCALLIAVLARIGLNPILGTEFPFVTIFPALVFAAYARGFWACMLAALLAWLATSVWVEGQVWPHDAAHATGVVVYMLTAAAIGWLGHVGVKNRTKLRESEERYRLLFERAPMGIAISRDGMYLAVNDAFCTISGRERDDLIGRHAESLMPPEYVEKRRAQLLTALSETGVWQGDFVLIRPDDSRVHIEAFAKVQRDGSIVALMSDITTRHTAEQEAGILKAELERRVEQRTEELTQANDQLQGFTYSIAHDLRQHIRGLNINATMIEQDAGDRLPADTLRHLGRLKKSAKQMAQLVEDLLAHARLGAQPVQSQRIDVSELAADAVEVVRTGEHGGGGAVFEIEPNLIAEGDPRLITTVLENLFDNSCKYRHAERPLVIHFGFADGAFYVRDNGIGFDMQFVDKLFEPFQRLHRAEDYPGTGIGLANVQRIIEKHGGRVWPESKPGEGATFFFTLPGGRRV